MAKINKAGLVEFIYEQDNFETKKQSAEFLDDLLTLIQDTVASGDEVNIAGFGKFERFESSTTGKKFPKFRPFKDFTDAVK